MESRRISAALRNVAAIPRLVFLLAFWSTAVLAAFRTVKLALGVRNLATEAVALQWD
jgi:hypothetical protein